MKKKMLIISLILIVCAAFAFADAYQDVNKYLNQGLSDANVAKIKELSPQLTEQQKKSIYTWKKVDVVFPFLENTFLGFGSGSFSQGDTTHGIIFLAGDLVGFGLVAYNIMTTSWDNFIGSITGKGGSDGDMTLAKVGLIGVLGLRVYQAIRPFTYSKNYNAKLKDAIGYNETAVAILPTKTKDGMGMTLSAKVSF